MSAVEQGESILDRLDPDAAAHLRSGLGDLAPDLAEYLVEFAFGTIYARPGLDLRTREIVAVTALSAQSGLAPQLKSHIGYALNLGMTEQELVEIFLMVTLFAGVPAGINAISALRETIAEREAP